MLITPGIRPFGADSNDQARVATPEEAIKAGADLLVIGRPITRAADPGAAAAAIAATLRRAAGGRRGLARTAVQEVVIGHTGIKRCLRPEMCSA